MAILDARLTNTNFLKKGFVKASGDHNYFEFWYKGGLIARTKTSHNNQDIDNYLIGLMSKQLKMDKLFFIAFAKCTKKYEDYISLLSENKIIEV